MGAAEGMAIAAILNGITTKSEIRSIIRWESALDGSILLHG